MVTLDPAWSKTLRNLWECHAAEQRGELSTAESQFSQSLDQASRARKRDSLLLIHYIDFIRRHRGIQEAIGLVTDLKLAESEQITADVELFFLSSLRWCYDTSLLDRSTVGGHLTTCARNCRGKGMLDSTICLADFSAFSEALPRQAIKETARAVLNSKTSGKISYLSDELDALCAEYGFKISSTARKSRALFRKQHREDLYVLSSSREDLQEPVIDEVAKATDVSWVDAKLPAFRLCKKFSSGSNLPDASLLEFFVDPASILEDDR